MTRYIKCFLLTKLLLRLSREYTFFYTGCCEPKHTIRELSAQSGLENKGYTFLNFHLYSFKEKKKVRTVVYNWTEPQQLDIALHSSTKYAVVGVNYFITKSSKLIKTKIKINQMTLNPLKMRQNLIKCVRQHSFFPGVIPFIISGGNGDA